ncbi:MAG: phosphoribosylglycinamide formyltransferase [Balneolaceae bacterium]
MKNIVVFASGSGSNFQSIIDSIEAGKLDASITGLISNKHGIKSLERANENNIPFKVIAETDFKTFEQYAEVLLEQLQNWNTDLIVLAGFLKKVPPKVIQVFDNRILNIHPSLLPKYGGKGFYGLKVHTAVIEAGDSVSGCSVHIVSEEYDKGPILEQATVPVYNNDTPEKLASRILEQEHILYPKVISNYLTSFS